MIVDFFVVGAARSGTTSIYNYLSLHPKIYLPNVKECNFFSDVESMDYEAYEPIDLDKQYHMKIIKSQEVYDTLYENAPEDALKGEVSPSYLWDKNTAEKIYQHNPNAKIIISLRNPIKRAFSHYLMHFNTGYEKQKTFEKAIDARKVEIWGGGNMYLEMGLYFEQVSNYLKYFGKENVKILIYEDWILDTENYVNDIYKFLNITSFSIDRIDKKHNETFVLKNISVINFLRRKGIKKVLSKFFPEELRDKMKKRFFSDATAEQESLQQTTYENLVNYYKTDITKLEELLDHPLSEKWQISND